MRRKELPALTALRFPAALAIVIFHYLLSASIVPRWTYQNLSLGVSFFYVLSGFILCYNYPNITDRKQFWLSRFARIWPVHCVMLVFTILVLPWQSLIGHASWWATLPVNFFLLQAWLPWKGSMLSYNGVSWSLSVEFFFYFMFPWLLLLFRRCGAPMLLAGSFFLGVAILALGQMTLGWPSDYGTFFPPCRLFEFLLGMQACRLWQKSAESGEISPWHEIASLVVTMTFVLGVGPTLWQMTTSLPLANWLLTEVAALCFSWTIWTFAHQAGPVSKGMSGWLAVQLGQVSFSLYMCHQVVERLLYIHRLDLIFTPGIFLTLYLVISMAGAYLLFFLVENPVRHWIVNAYRRSGSDHRPDSGEAGGQEKPAVGR